MAFCIAAYATGMPHGEILMARLESSGRMSRTTVSTFSESCKDQDGSWQIACEGRLPYTRFK